MVDDVTMRLRQALPGLRPAERRIAELTLASPATAAEMTITTLAERCATSPASVIRLCRTLDYPGYPAFRIALARAAADEQGRRLSFGVEDADIEPDDGARDVARKLAYHETRAIEETANALDVVELDRVVDAVVQAPVIDIYGSGSSTLAGQDLMQKLRRIGYQANCWIDSHLGITSAAVLRPGSVAIGFSHSGRTSETLAALRTASAAGAHTVAVTNFPDAPLAKAADSVLTTTSRETRFRSGAMASRMAQLTVVDILFLRVAQRAPEAVTVSLTATYDAITSRHERASEAG
ncbi:MurR/RpiR family transcriptional regulator [Streptomyces antioxidans]|uniref:MurR/RpiR family transcriptional regulator n=2 Tax=Streptomyces antioxidans TaxID=1507734 RepID=A0A1V4DBT3_9ACTN|nr:MurR/RpiR family transcriptional regulator [Streptomyces antioxidans]OPF83801.1 MurR/RpiR family transcriptional regulator [Streptomyces antioxidans]